MAFSAQDIEDVARTVGQRIFVSDGGVAHADFDNLKSAVGSLDTSMNATTDVAQAAHPGVTIQAAMLAQARIGAPNLTANEGRIALAYWALREAGLI